MTAARPNPKTRALTSLRTQMEELREAERLLIEGVKLAREQGATWDEIAEATGLSSRQAAFDRFAKRLS